MSALDWVLAGLFTLPAGMWLFMKYEQRQLRRLRAQWAKALGVRDE